MEGRLARWSPISGIAFAVLFLVGSVLADSSPSIGASDADILAFYGSSDSQGKLQVAYFVLTLAALLFLWFVGTLSARVRRAEGSPGWASRIVAASGAACTAVLILGYALGGAVADIGDDTDAFTVDPNTTRLLLDVAYTLSFETALPLAAPMVLAASLVALRERLLPRRLAWAGVGVAILCLAGFLGIPIGLLALWVVAVAVQLVRSPTMER
jgi:hypothetical protein